MDFPLADGERRPTPGLWPSWQYLGVRKECFWRFFVDFVLIWLELFRFFRLLIGLYFIQTLPPDCSYWKETEWGRAGSSAVWSSSNYGLCFRGKEGSWLYCEFFLCVSLWSKVEDWIWKPDGSVSSLGLDWQRSAPRVAKCRLSSGNQIQPTHSALLFSWAQLCIQLEHLLLSLDCPSPRNYIRFHQAKIRFGSASVFCCWHR